jgi:hypothetical protein
MRGPGVLVGRVSAVGIATRYVMDGPGIESRRGRDFSYLSRPAKGPTRPLVRWVPSPFPGGKAAGGSRWPPTSSSAEVEKRVKLYLHFRVWAFMAYSRVKFTFYQVYYNDEFLRKLLIICKKLFMI